MYLDFSDREIVFSDPLGESPAEPGSGVELIKNPFYSISVPGNPVVYGKDAFNRFFLNSTAASQRRYLAPTVSEDCFMLAAVYIEEPNTVFDFDMTLPEPGEHVIGFYRRADGYFRYIFDGVLVESKTPTVDIEPFQFKAASYSIQDFLMDGDVNSVGVGIHNLLFAGCRVFNLYATNKPIDKYKQDKFLIEIGRRISLSRYSIIEEEYTGPSSLFIDWWTESITDSTIAGWPY